MRPCVYMSVQLCLKVGTKAAKSGLTKNKKQEKGRSLWVGCTVTATSNSGPIKKNLLKSRGFVRQIHCQYIHCLLNGFAAALCPQQLGALVERTDKAQRLSPVCAGTGVQAGGVVMSQHAEVHQFAPSDLYKSTTALLAQSSARFRKRSFDWCRLTDFSTLSINVCKVFTYFVTRNSQ